MEQRINAILVEEAKPTVVGAMGQVPRDALAPRARVEAPAERSDRAGVNHVIRENLRLARECQDIFVESSTVPVSSRRGLPLQPFFPSLPAIRCPHNA
jgi:hypothetical protein